MSLKMPVVFNPFQPFRWFQDQVSKQSPETGKDGEVYVW